MKNKAPILAILALIIVAVLATSAFTVKEGQKALKIRLGQIQRSDYEPGLYLKLPIVEEINRFDARLTLTDSGLEHFLTSEKKNVIVDFFILWQVDDPIEYFTSVQGNLRAAEDRLLQIMKDSLRGEFGKRTVQEVVSGERGDVADVLSAAGVEAKQLGVELVDVRIKRIDLPDNVSGDVFNRMRSERKRIATELRAEGNEAAEKIRADADRQATVLRADAFRDSEKARGEGDAKAAEIYATAYERDAEFYSFYRSLGAYRQVLSSRSDVMVLDPNSEFFRYFNSASGTKVPSKATPKP